MSEYGPQCSQLFKKVSGSLLQRLRGYALIYNAFKKTINKILFSLIVMLLIVIEEIHPSQLEEKMS